MLDYEWGNPSTILLAGNEGAGATESDQTHRQIFDHNYTFLHDPFVHGSTLTTTTGFSHHHSFNSPQPQQQHPFFDPRAFPGASATSFSPTPSVLSLNPIPPVTPSHCELGPGSGLGLVLMPKSEDVTPAMNFGASGLGLNLGGRTYFASCNDDMVSRLYRRSKMVESVSVSSNFPRCQAEGCNADLSDAKHYHRRHKVCEYHSKAATVIAAGLTQRFCQQCSRLLFFTLRKFLFNDENATRCYGLEPIIGFEYTGRSRGHFRPVMEISLIFSFLAFCLPCYGSANVLLHKLVIPQ